MANHSLSTAKQVNEVNCESGFIGLMEKKQNTDDRVVPIKILGKSVQFKIDSSADHSVIPSNVVQTVLKNAKTKKTDKIIFGPDRRL